MKDWKCHEKYELVIHSINWLWSDTRRQHTSFSSRVRNRDPILVDINRTRFSHYLQNQADEFQLIKTNYLSSWTVTTNTLPSGRKQLPCSGKTWTSLLCFLVDTSLLLHRSTWWLLYTSHLWSIYFLYSWNSVLSLEGSVKQWQMY